MPAPAKSFSMLHAAFAMAILLSVMLMMRFLFLHESLPSNLPQAADKVDSNLHKILRAQRRMEDRLERLSRTLETMQLHQREEDMQMAHSHDDEDDDEDDDSHKALESSPYQQWQARIAYFHWKKQKAASGACTDMVALHRLCATKGGAPDGLEKEIPTIFTVQLSDEVINSHFGFGVLNRPNSVKQLLNNPELRSKLVAPYVFLLETDHVFMRPLPNLATATQPVAWDFGYMHAHRAQNPVIQKYWPEGDHSKLDPVGPSPLLIHIDQLGALTSRWLDFSLGLRANSEAERVMQGWVQEMWGYSIAAASVGITHKVMGDLQIEASSLTSHVDPKFTDKHYIFHYTYGIEYTMGGKPQGVNNIGEWSLDKRHYGSDHPPRHLQPPPDGANAAAYWLLAAWNEASAGIPDWPTSHSMGTIGWRRIKPTAEQMESSREAQAVRDTKWTWGGDERGITFKGDGQLVTPWDPKGTWGLIRSASEGEEDGIAKCTNCLFADFANANHNLRFDLDADPPTFVAIRVGDLARVDGKKKGAA